MKQLFIFATALVAAPLSAQNEDLGQPIQEGGEVETVMEAEDGEGLTFTITDETALEDLGIAIPGFATDADVATPANQNGTAALGKELARVITADLRNNGLFKPTGLDALLQPSFPRSTRPTGRPVNAGGNAGMAMSCAERQPAVVGCYLYDMACATSWCARAGLCRPPTGAARRINAPTSSIRA